MAQVLKEKIEEVPLPPTTPITVTVGDLSDVKDQLDYLLNATVNRHVPMIHRTFYDPPENRVGGDPVKIEKGDHISTMDYAKVLGKSIALKSKLKKEGKHWWTFADVVPTWNENIEHVMKFETAQEVRGKLASVVLGDGFRCIMGESYGGGSWGNQCTDCSWLGGSGLKYIVDTEKGVSMITTDRAKYEEYKTRYEYHWNKYHNDLGDSRHEKPEITSSEYFDNKFI